MATRKSKGKAPKAVELPADDAGERDAPVLFRLNVEVGNLADAVRFYTELLGVRGRTDRGARCYFDCGQVTLQVVDVSSTGPVDPAAALYFVVRDLDAVFVRARMLGCLSPDDVHGEPGGAIAVRPWGEKSFYVEDPWGNALCFVEDGTVYRG